VEDNLSDELKIAEPVKEPENRRMSALMLSLLMMGYFKNMGIGGPFRRRSYGPDADDGVINPPQSEESKQYHLKRAEERREAKKLKRLQSHKEE
jgi:hypothetical protein